MAQSFIFFGNSSSQNLKKALDFSTSYLKKSTTLSEESLEKHINNMTYPNLFILEKAEDANEITIDDARKVKEFLSKKPLIQGNTVVLIKSAEFLSKSSANCLLKILEEPPQDSILILTTNKLMNIIPTIRSRCVKIKIASKRFNVDDFSDFSSYVENVLGDDANKELLKRSVAFIENKMNNVSDFAKSIENSELDIFVMICFLYSYFCFHESLKESHANVVLELQNLMIVSKNTYPDKQSLIIAIKNIFEESLYK